MKLIISKLALLFTFLLLFANIAFPQWEEGQINVRFSIPEIALIDIEPEMNNSINFAILPTNQPGASPEIQEPKNKSLWINYSSSLSDSRKNRSVFAEISDGYLPEGISLFLEASRYLGNGNGKTGQPNGKIELTKQPRSIISGIGSCFSGNGINNGHSLTFSIEIADYSKVVSSDEAVLTIIYTISDN